MKQPKLILFADPGRPRAAKAMADFRTFVNGKAHVITNCLDGTCSVDALSEADFAVVFGGDGTILGAARQLCQTEVPVIGVNVGKLGFLAEFSLTEIEQLFSRIITDASLIEPRMVLRCTLESPANPLVSSTAVNDVVVTAGSPFNMIELKIEVDGQLLASCIGDGLIVSTPTGSTAYNLSAGGPILSANLSAMVLTAVSPHSLSFRPIVLRAESRIRITPQCVNQNTTLLLDGNMHHSLTSEDVIVVEKHQGDFLVVNNPMRTQWDTLDGKLKWAQKPRYQQDEPETPHKKS